MGAISSEFVNLLKVKLSLQNDLLLSWFLNPPSRLENMWFIFQFNTAQHKPLVKVRF